MGKRSFRYYILGILVMSTISVAQSKYDVFPLRPNYQFTYSYFYKYIITNPGPFIIVFAQDSGTVKYEISDSASLNDTTIVWNINEQRFLFHKKLK